MLRLLIAILAVLASLPGAGAQNPPTITLVATDPGTGKNVGKNSPLYIRIAYQSDVPIRAQAKGYLAGQPVDAGASFNPAPAYPAGVGEGIAWIAYDRPTRLDEVRIEVFDARWQPLLTKSLPVTIAWTGLADSNRMSPEWVRRLSDAQQASTTESLQEMGEGGVLGWIVGLLMAVGVPGYFVLQILFGIRWSGRWRIAALAPLAFMLPAIGHAVFALAAGSNIWPIIVILVAPVAFLYLAGLFVARRVIAA